MKTPIDNLTDFLELVAATGPDANFIASLAEVQREVTAA